MALASILFLSGCPALLFSVRILVVSLVFLSILHVCVSICVSLLALFWLLFQFVSLFARPCSASCSFFVRHCLFFKWAIFFCLGTCARTHIHDPFAMIYSLGCPFTPPALHFYFHLILSKESSCQRMCVYGLALVFLWASSLERSVTHTRIDTLSFSFSLSSTHARARAHAHSSSACIL